MSNRDQAITLARQGFKVFPIAPGQKSPPLIVGWQLAATTDESVVRNWFTEWPQANIGIHCDGLVVLDVDSHKGGDGSLLELEIAHELPRTLEVSTPSGGRHIYYNAGTEIANGVDVYGRGIDVRGHHGYVLAPGSLVNGKPYTILTQAPIAEAPEFLKHGRAAAVVPTVRDPIPTSDLETAITKAREYLMDVEAAVQGHGGDDKTYRTAAAVLEIVPDIEAAITAMADWNDRCEPPWEDGCRAKVEAAWRYMQEQPGRRTPEAMFDELPAPPSKPVDSAVRLRHPSEVTREAVLAQDYIVKGFLDARSNVVLFGKWHVGKSFTALDLGAAIAVGTPWFGRRVSARGVLYVSYEGVGAVPRRLLALREKYPGIADGSTPFAWVAAKQALITEAGAQWFAEVVRAFREQYGTPGVVIIDPMMNALGGDDSDAALMNKLNELVGHLVQSGITIIRVHHTGHANEDRARGHSSLEASADTEIRVAEGEIASIKQRDGEKCVFNFALKVVTLGVDQDGDPVTTCVIEPASEAPRVRDFDNETDEAVFRKCQELADVQNRVERETLRQECMTEGVIGSRQSLYKVVQRLKKSGRLAVGKRFLTLTDTFTDETSMYE